MHGWSRVLWPSWSALQPEPEQQHRPEVAPPVDDRASARVCLATFCVGDSDRNFFPSVATEEGLGEEVRLDLVAPEPRLMNPDPRVIEDLQSVGLVAAGCVRHAAPNKN